MSKISEFQKILKESTLKIYWWNHEQKLKDFEGTYKEWFNSSNNKIYLKPLKDKQGYISGVYFSGYYGNLYFKIYLLGDVIYCCNKMIMILLTYLGDKTMLIDGYNREYKINWR